MLAAILACALIGYERIAAVSGLAALIAYGPLGQHIQLVWLARVLVPIACLLVMVCAPQRRPRDPRRLLWLLPVACACGAPRPRPRQPAGSSRGHVRRRTAPTPPRPTVSDRVQPGLDRPAASRRGPTGPGRSALARDPAAVAAGLMLTVAAGRLWIMRHSATAVANPSRRRRRRESVATSASTGSVGRSSRSCCGRATA